MSDTENPTTHLTMPASELVTAITNALLFASTDEYLPTVNGVWLEWTGAELRSSATDRYIVGEYTAEATVNHAGEPWLALLPRARATSLVRTFKPAKGEESELVQVIRDGAALTVKSPATASWNHLDTKATRPDFEKLLNWPDEPVGAISFNPAKLATFSKLQHDTCDVMCLTFSGPAGLVKVRIGERFRGLIMPVKTPADLEQARPKPVTQKASPCGDCDGPCGEADCTTSGSAA